ncbi:hypothetical protein TNIN_129251 [Trichonephila inaurata madagascariensis]|uniref:Uncharacterized protein n=1 Tax=Trichonephila inaurata madagascariensis TaxID=2747483 RepID=A0A8X6Y519_9ARAC|nr:hypothetical protein TNIN_129251 [Trichonephila inaurata madagascariensis]
MRHTPLRLHNAGHNGREYLNFTAPPQLHGPSALYNDRRIHRAKSVEQWLECGRKSAARTAFFIAERHAAFGLIAFSQSNLCLNGQRSESERKKKRLIRTFRHNGKIRIQFESLSSSSPTAHLSLTNLHVIFLRLRRRKGWGGTAMGVEERKSDLPESEKRERSRVNEAHVSRSLHHCLVPEVPKDPRSSRTPDAPPPGRANGLRRRKGERYHPVLTGISWREKIPDLICRMPPEKPVYYLH